jgi:hypothetical protein
MMNCVVLYEHSYVLFKLFVRRNSFVSSGAKLFFLLMTLDTFGHICGCMLFRDVTFKDLR